MGGMPVPVFRMHRAHRKKRGLRLTVCQAPDPVFLFKKQIRPVSQGVIPHLPDYVFPAAMLVFGYPTQQQKEREKPERVPLKHVVHENAYREMDADEYREMFAQRTAVKGHEAWMQAFCDRKFNSEFSREMTRSVQCYLDQFIRRD